MKTTDIKPGTFYAYKARSWSASERVKVLNPTFDGNVKVKQNWGGTRTEHQKGVQIEFRGGQVEVVRPQTIVSTWADHQREQKAAKADRAEREAEKAAALKRAAETVVALDALLRSKGAKVHGGAYCHEDEKADALRAAGMPPAGPDDTLDPEYADEHVGRNDHFSSVFYSLSDALRGRFDLDVLAHLVKEA